MNFIEFLAESENKELGETLEKLPKKHYALVKGFKFEFQSGNTLKGDKNSVGFIDEAKKKIIIASPWNYGREYTVLHEIGHLIWKYLVDEDKRKEWKTIVSKTKHKQDQNAEELFCMAYSDAYAKNKIEIHHHPEWEKFIRKLPK